jgi:endoglucanase
MTGADSDTSIVLTAHMDEIGVMVSGHDDDGRLEFVPVGGIDPRSLPNTVVRFSDERRGTIGLPAPHLCKDKTKAPEIDDLRIDVGYSKKVAKDLFPVGTVGVFEVEPFMMGADQYVARNVDNRSGCAILIRLAWELYEFGALDKVAFAFTTREEVGLMGAKGLQDWFDEDTEFINVDVTTAGDLGKGAIVSVKDGGYMANAEMLAKFRKIGKNFEVGKGGTSDHAAMQYFHRVIGISLPSAYIHSGVGKVSLRDMNDAKAMIYQYIAENHA